MENYKNTQQPDPKSHLIQATIGIYKNIAICLRIWLCQEKQQVGTKKKK